MSAVIAVGIWSLSSPASAGLYYGLADIMSEQAAICLKVDETVNILQATHVAKPRMYVNVETYKAFLHLNEFVADLVYRGVNGEDTTSECFGYAPVIFAVKYKNAE
jgi:hypothetical protein